MAEKRLISYDYIRQKALADPDSGEAIVYLQDIAEVPTVDAVEVVRCKDCKFGVIPYGDEHDGWIECSNIHGRPLFGCDGFCSYGERKSNGKS